MAIRPTIAKSLRQILNYIGLPILCLQGVLAQQCLNSNGIKYCDGSQQSLPKPPCNLNQPNSGQNFHASQHANLNQMNFQQPSNIQQASFMQQTSNVQPQWNLQQVGSQPPINSMSNSQAPQQHNQNYASHTFSSLQNVRPVQGTNMAQINSYQQTNSQPISATLVAKSQYGNQASLVEPPQFQPTFTFQPTQSKSPQTNTPPIQPQTNQPTNFNSYVNTQTIDNNSQNQPVSNSASNQQVASVHNPVTGTQKNTVQTPPIILTLQAPQMIPVQSLPTLTSGQIGVNQPIVYAVQTPSSASIPNQQIVPKQANRSNNGREDESFMNYMMSQIQNQLGSDNALASVLPAILNKKSEKSSLKTLLPLILNIMNERGSGCVCPHCGCNNNNQKNQEPVINSGYSNKKIYSCQESASEELTKTTDSNDIQGKDVTDSKNNDAIVDDFVDVSEEEEEDEEDESEEYYEDE